MQDDPRSQEEEPLPVWTRLPWPNLLNASPFSITSIFQDRCWTVKLSTLWLVVLETKRGTIRPTTLCKEGLTWECTIATLALVGWSTLDLAAIQEGGDGRDGACCWIESRAS